MVSATVDLYKQGETGPSGESGIFLSVIPITVIFKATILSGTPTAYLWDFGDGTTSDVLEPEHTFTSYGYHRVVLTITDAYGDTVVPFYTVILGKLDFTVDVVRGQSPLIVRFSDASVAPSGCQFTGMILSYGDGYTGMLSNPAHTYVGVGKYSVRLDATISNS